MALGIEADFNEFASIVMDGVQAMLTMGLSPAEAAGEIHDRLTVAS